MLRLLDDFLQQPLAVLQAGDLRFVVGQRPGQAQPFVAEGGAGRVRHHHRAQLLLVELRQNEALEKGKGKGRGGRAAAGRRFYFSHHLVQIVLQDIEAVVCFGLLWRYSLVLLFVC